MHACMAVALLCRIYMTWHTSAFGIHNVMGLMQIARNILPVKIGSGFRLHNWLETNYYLSMKGNFRGEMQVHLYGIYS